MKGYVLQNSDGKYFVKRRKFYQPDKTVKDINRAHIFGHLCMDKTGYRILEVEVAVKRVLGDVSDQHKKVVFGG